MLAPKHIPKPERTVSQMSLNVLFIYFWTTLPLSGNVVGLPAPRGPQEKSCPSPGMELMAAPIQGQTIKQAFERVYTSDDLATPLLNVYPKESKDLQEVFAYLCS